MTALVLMVVLIALLGVATTWSYNRFARQRQLLLDAWSDVDTELRRRHDLVPNLVAVVQGYAAHERSTFASVAEARRLTAEPAPAGPGQTSGEAALGASLHQLLAVAEAYPQLQADQHFRDLQHQLVATEDRIQAARRLYNGNVRDYDQRVDSFPSMVVARAFHFERAHYFQLEAAAGATPMATGPSGASTGSPPGAP